jgi:hypothetical protein
MRKSEFGGAPWRLIAIQLAILAGLLIFFKFYLPHHARMAAAQASAARERKITTFFNDAVAEDTGREVSVPLDGSVVKRHPKRLRTTFGPDEAQTMLGVPNTSMVDFRGGQHLTWIGTTHKVEAAFDKGHLFCLTQEDLTTHRGELVYDSNDMYRLF